MLVCISFRFPVLPNTRVRSDPLDRGNDPPCALFGEFLSVCIVKGFTVSALALNDSYFKLLCFKEFDVGSGSCVMTDEWDISSSQVPVGILASDSYR